MSKTITIPGMLDPHVHLRGMEWSHKGTFASETTAAIAGGYWAVLDMPNTAPPTITRHALDRKMQDISSQAVCDWGLYFGASQDDNWREYEAIMPKVCGLKIYNNATTGTLLIEDQQTRAHHYEAWTHDRTIAVHAEGKTVEDIIKLVRQYRRPTHFCHISTAQEIGLLTVAKNEGLPISVGVCPHHLYFTQDDIKTLGSLGLMKPELKTRADQEALWKAIRDGIVDIIESDHAPHTLAEKYGDRPPFGVPGLETTLPLMLLAVQERGISIDRVAELVSANPRRIWGIQCPPETFTIVEIDAHFVVERQRLHTGCGWSPFEGMRVRGKITEVWIRGQKVFDGETVLASSGHGRNLYRYDT